jgi:hypothetical protein
MLSPSSGLKCIGSGIGLVIVQISYNEGDYGTQREGVKKGTRSRADGEKRPKKKVLFRGTLVIVTYGKWN